MFIIYVISKEKQNKTLEHCKCSASYFNDLSLRNTTKALSRFVKKSHTAIRDCWIQKYKPKKLSFLIKKIAKHIIDETLIKVGSGYIWLWIAI